MYSVFFCVWEQRLKEFDVQRALTSTPSNTFGTARPNRPTSVLDLTHALAAGWEQIPAARLLNLVENLNDLYCWGVHVRFGPYSVQHEA